MVLDLVFSSETTPKCTCIGLKFKHKVSLSPPCSLHRIKVEEKRELFTAICWRHQSCWEHSLPVVPHIINDEKIQTYELIIMLCLNYLQNNDIRRTVGLQNQADKSKEVPGLTLQSSPLHLHYDTIFNSRITYFFPFHRVPLSIDS